MARDPSSQEPCDSKAPRAHEAGRDNWYAIGVSSDDPDNFQGFHGAGGLLFIADEAMGVTEPIFTAADGFTTEPGCKEFYVFNPTRRAGRAFDVCQPGSGWHVPRMSAFDAPPERVTDKWLEARRKQYGLGGDPEDDPRWWAYVLGEFPPTSEKALVPLDLLERQAFAEPEGLPGRRMGVDVARHGSDFNVATLLIDGRVSATHRWKERSTMKTAGMVVRLMQRWEVTARLVGIDVGMGAGVIDRLRELDHPVSEIDFGGSGNFGSTGPYPQLVGEDRRFHMRRCMMFWTVRAMLEANVLAIPRRYERLWSDLGAIEYDYTGRDALAVTSKKELKEILGRSIDDADALVCAIHAGTGERERGPRFAFPAA